MQTQGGENTLLMKCTSWNANGLHDEWRRAVGGRYLHKWVAMVVYLQETMLESCGT